MIRGDIDLTKDLDFYHDNSDKFKDKAVSGCCPWESGSLGTIKIDNSTYLVPDQVVEYNQPDVYLDDAFQENSFISSTTQVQPVSFHYNGNSTISTISYNNNNQIIDNYYIDYEDQYNTYTQTLTIRNGSSKYKLKWNTSPKLDYGSEIDCFGYHKKEKWYKSIFAMISEFEDRPKKYFPLIPWDNDDKSSIMFQYYNNYHFIELPWDNEYIIKDEGKRYYHGIPWLDKLNRWVREDYLDELDGYIKDNTKYLTDMGWFHTSRNEIH